MTATPYLTPNALRALVARCEQRLARERGEWRLLIRWGLEWCWWEARRAAEQRPLEAHAPAGNLGNGPPRPLGLALLAPRVHGASGQNMELLGHWQDRVDCDIATG